MIILEHFWKWNKMYKCETLLKLIGCYMISFLTIILKSHKYLPLNSSVIESCDTDFFRLLCRPLPTLWSVLVLGFGLSVGASSVRKSNSPGSFFVLVSSFSSEITSEMIIIIMFVHYLSFAVCHINKNRKVLG
jgi:hypothetical protein